MANRHQKFHSHHAVRSRTSAALSAAIAVVLSAAASAADGVDSKVEEVMVTASRVERPLSTIPNTVTVVTTAELEAQLAVHNDISTVLGNLIPSFSPSRQKMTNAGESLRGRKPLYMIDGVPQSSPLREGGRDGHIIDNAVLERIEVLHGANAIHGLGAAGGIINLITKKPSDTFQQSFRADSTFQTEDIGESSDYGVAYSVSNRFGNADVLASLSLRDSGISYDANGDVIGSDNTQGDTMDSRTLNAFVKTGYDWENQRVELTFNRYDIEGNNDWISVPGNVAAGIPSSAVKGQHRRRRRAQQSHERLADLRQRRFPRPQPARAGVQPGSRIDLRRRGDTDRDLPGSRVRPEPHRPVAEQLGKGGREDHAGEGPARRAAAESGLWLRRAGRRNLAIADSHGPQLGAEVALRELRAIFAG